MTRYRCSVPADLYFDVEADNLSEALDKAKRAVSLSVDLQVPMLPQGQVYASLAAGPKIERTIERVDSLR